MMSLPKHLKIISIFFFAILFLFFFDKCKKEVPNKKYVAKVNNSYLTHDELDSMYNFSAGIQYRDEIIRNWINRELLFQEARRQGILDDKNYKRILDDSKKELAGSFLLKDFFEKEKITAEPSELEKYYNNNESEFKLSYNSYLLNLVTFNNEDKALKFRSALLEKGWDNAFSEIKNDSSIIDKKSKALIFEHEIQPVSILRVVKELYPSEISIVINNEGDEYSVVQLLEKFAKGSIPPFELIQKEVKNMYLMKKKELNIRDYIKELYSKNDIEVKN
jgi:PPIC-type PPIASE domain